MTNSLYLKENEVNESSCYATEVIIALVADIDIFEAWLGWCSWSDVPEVIDISDVIASDNLKVLLNVST